MASKVGIVNIGLAELGESTLTTLTGTLKRQEVATALYDKARRALLTDTNWRMATHTQSLVKRAASPANTKYKNAFAMPTDPAPIKVQHIEPNPADYVIEGESLLINSDTVLMTYTADVAEEVMPPYFEWLLGLKMGHVMAMPLTKSKTKKDSMKDDFDDYIVIAKRADASQQPNTLLQDNPFIDARG